MKKRLPYILIGIILLAAAGIFITNNRSNSKRKLDERLTLHKRDKIPYGLYVAYNSLENLFPDALVSSNRKEPGLWEEISSDSTHQALVIITPEFNADEYEMNSLTRFVQEGNDVFLSARTLSAQAQQFLHLTATGGGSEMYMPIQLIPDTLDLTLEEGSFPGPHAFTFPGKRFANAFSHIDEDITKVKGRDRSAQPQFIALRSGAGHFYVHLAPIAFSNYFLLHKSNLSYYEQAMSVISPGTRKIVWDEYYRYKTEKRDNQKKGWFTTLMNMKNSEGKRPFRAAIIIVMVLLLCYVLLEMRRKQRPVPIIRKEANASLEFTKTIGRLYHDKADHNNLARKMTAYFLEHVRTRYKLVTTELDDQFIRQLHYKTGVEEKLIADIVSSIRSLDHFIITEQQLAAFHKQLETFYKTA